jgi:predicted nucleic acid-binding protein
LRFVLDADGDLETFTIPAGGQLEKTLQIARSYDRSFYDSLYIAVAVQQEAPLVRADEKHANAATAYLPVKRICSLSC